MVVGLSDYFNEIHPGKSNFDIGKIPDKDKLVSRIHEIEKLIETYSTLPRSDIFYDGYINGICDGLVLLSKWDPWLVHSFIHTYLIVRFTDKYLTDDRSDSWINSLSKSLKDYYDEGDRDSIIGSISVSPN